MSTGDLCLKLKLLDCTNGVILFNFERKQIEKLVNINKKNFFYTVLISTVSSQKRLFTFMEHMPMLTDAIFINVEVI